MGRKVKRFFKINLLTQQKAAYKAAFAVHS